MVVCVFVFGQREHTDTLMHLRMMLSFTDGVLEIAAVRAGGADLGVSAASLCPPQDSVVVDQISQLSREWGYVGSLQLSLTLWFSRERGRS